MTQRRQTSRASTGISSSGTFARNCLFVVTRIFANSVSRSHGGMLSSPTTTFAPTLLTRTISARLRLMSENSPRPPKL
jgi:hypothetical protein